MLPLKKLLGMIGDRVNINMIGKFWNKSLLVGVVVESLEDLFSL